MTPTEFRGILDCLGLTQAEAARLLGANERTVRRWATAERSVPPAVVILLRMMFLQLIEPAAIDGLLDRPMVIQPRKRRA